MPRKLPQVREGRWYHVVNRATDKAPVLSQAKTKDAFVTALGELAYESPIEIHAYCAMETHYHVLARGVEDDIHAAFARLDRECALAVDGVRLRPMTVGRHLLHVTRYIHRNPCEAGLVWMPAEWSWSSYRAYLDRLDGPRWLRSHTVLGWLGSMGARLRYRQYVEGIEGDGLLG
ncbi:MAG: hypothetical protein GY716_17295 [bacterium]|nr:hypothetical protein [bacterium]